MSKITVAYAIKLEKGLNGVLDSIGRDDQANSTYSYLAGEEPVPTVYDFESNNRSFRECAELIVALKTLLHEANLTLPMDSNHTIDDMLTLLPIMNRRAQVLKDMAQRQPKRSRQMGNSSQITVCNYYPEVVREAYNQVNNEVIKMQNLIDAHNASAQIEIADDLLEQITQMIANH